MKKYLMIVAIFAVALVVLPAKTQAQYNPYWNGTFLRYALASQRAKAMRARGKKKVIRKKSSRKVVRRRSSRVSMLENMIQPRYRTDVDLPKRSSIV